MSLMKKMKYNVKQTFTNLENTHKHIEIERDTHTHKERYKPVHLYILQIQSTHIPSQILSFDPYSYLYFSLFQIQKRCQIDLETNIDKNHKCE